MYKKTILVSFFMALYVCSHAQNVAPALKWQKNYGMAVYLFSPSKVSLINNDGSYQIAATYFSDVHLSGGHRNNDIWVSKIDTLRNAKWSVSLGGTGNDGLFSLHLAHDSGYIVTGFSDSNDGDVSGNHGGGDVWVVRLNTQGKIMWQKCYGGSRYESGFCIEKTSDGYILLGNTKSKDGDVSGLHQDTTDIWVVKLDKNGNMQWQKCLGGSGEDLATAIKPTPDGGFIITGVTSSNDGDVQGLHGTEQDIWVVKIDKNGTVEWQKCLGGSRFDGSTDIDISPNGGYIIVGYTTSPDGDVTDYHLPDDSALGYDAWVISLSSTGQLQWQKAFGGGNDDEFDDIQVLPDHTYLAVGNTSSSNGDISYLNGNNNCWLVKLNTAGQIIWEKTIQSGGTSGDEYEYAVCSTLRPNGNLVIQGYTTNNYGDIWLFEVGAGNTIEGYTFYDLNGDGIKNNNESFFDRVTIRATKNGQMNSAIPKNGRYRLDVDTGAYVIQAIPNSPYHSPVPASKNVTFASFFNVDSAIFALQPQPGIRDLNVNLLPLLVARPGFGLIYQLNYKNVGTDITGAGNIKLVKDHRLNFINSTSAPATVSNDTITWSFNSFPPNVDSVIVLNFLLGSPPTANFGDVLHSVAWIQQDKVDTTPIDDTISLKQIVTGSFDPNDKTEANAGVISPAQVNNGAYLNYLVRFQNTGTDTAFNVTVRDTLETRLDWNTFQMVSASHTYQLSVQNGNKLTWQFNYIKLPQQGIDEPGSHGYIAYRIKPLSSVHVGDTIKNSASISFDYNLPVMTNTEKTIVLDLSVSLPVTLISFNALKAGSAVQVNWKTAIEEDINHFEVQRSTNGINFITIGTVSPKRTVYQFKDEKPIAGYNYYRLKSVDKDGAQSYSKVALVNLDNTTDIISLLYPNPAKGNVILKLQGTIKDRISIQIIDQSGRPLFFKHFDAQQANELIIPLNTGMLTCGYYMLQIIVGEKKYIHKLIVQ